MTNIRSLLILLLRNWYGKKKKRETQQERLFQTVDTRSIRQKRKNGCDISDIWSRTL